MELAIRRDSRSADENARESDRFTPSEPGLTKRPFGRQRAQTLADEEPDASEDPTRWNAYYYDASWRLLEHRYDDLTSASWTTPPTSFTADETKHYVWGMRYIDELVYYRKAVDEGRYALTDRNFSVIGLMEDFATDSDDERIRYTPYGEAVATLRSDVNQDGTVTSSGGGSDRSVITGASGKNIGEVGYIVEADLNRDGTINVSDSGMVTADNGNSITAGQVSAQGNIVGYDGYVFEPSTGMYCVRHRWYLPEVGRWGSRDRLDYVDGASQNLAFRSNPLLYSDRSGLSANTPEQSAAEDCKKKEKEKEKEDTKKSDGDDLHARKGAYYQYTLECCGKTVERSGWNKNLKYIIVIMQRDIDDGCCIKNFQISTHYDGIQLYAEKRSSDGMPIAACSSKSFIAAMKLCDGGTVNLNMCNTMRLGQRVAAANSGVDYDHIECTKGLNYHYPIDWYLVPGSGIEPPDDWWGSGETIIIEPDSAVAPAESEKGSCGCGG